MSKLHCVDIRDERLAIFDRAERRRTFTATSQWWRDASALLPGSVQSTSPLAWSLVLIPELVDPGYRMGDAPLHIYQSVTANAAIPPEFEACARTRWVRVSGAMAEVGISCTAVVDGEVVADSLTVSRVATGGLDVEDFGSAEVPSVPEAAVNASAGAFVINTDQTAGFSEVVHNYYALHDSSSYAQRRGYPNSLVQGHLLLLELLIRARMDSTGTGEAWFLRPVPVGALVILKQGIEGDADIWSMYVGGGQERAMVARIVRPD